MAKILITGGSGLVGKALSLRLLELNHEVVWLSRHTGTWRGIQSFEWNLSKKFIAPNALDGVTHVVHLAGAGVMDKPWTDTYKAELVSSRVDSMALLISYFRTLGSVPQVLVGMSATGYYGSTLSDEKKAEGSASGNDFLASVCAAWENAYKPMESMGTRTVIARMGVVLSNEGGAYPPLLKMAKLHVSTRVGSGQQYFPWVHIDDVVSFFCTALFDDSFTSVYNLVAPNTVRNAQFASALAHSVKRGIWTPAAPSSVMKLLLGERSTALTMGAHVKPERLLERQFAFKYADAESALKQLLQKN